MYPLPPLPEPEPFPTDPSSAFHRYSQSLQLIMMDFQYIEEGLRMCLLRAYALIHIRMKSILPFHPPFDALQKDALGRLVSKFEQFSDDKELISGLRDIQPFRNRCAHRGMLLTVEEQKDVGFLSTETKAIEAKRVSAQECLGKLLAEWQRLETVLNEGAHVR